jgi:hypothetical protein
MSSGNTVVVNPFIRTVQDTNPVARRPSALHVEPATPVVPALPSVPEVTAPMLPLPIVEAPPTLPVPVAPVEPVVFSAIGDQAPVAPSTWPTRIWEFIKKHSLVIGGSILTFVIVVILLGWWKDADNSKDD